MFFAYYAPNILHTVEFLLCGLPITYLHVKYFSLPGWQSLEDYVAIIVFWPMDENISSSGEGGGKPHAFFSSLDSGEQIYIIVTHLDILIFKQMHLKA